MNINNVDYQEHDEVTNAKKVTVVGGSITAAGQVTVTPQQAWPDPKGYIGLVTVTGNLSASLGGNITLNPGPNYIGLTTTTLAEGLANIGFATVALSTPTIFAVVNTSAPGVSNSIVTVANTPLAVSFSGNVTLDAGSKTQIVGNVTLSDSKGFIGLTTTTLGASPAFVGIVTIANASMPVTFSGNVTLDGGSLTGIKGNVTISDSKNFIGLVTVGNRVDLNSNVTLNASPNYIGLVTIANASMPVTFSGNVTLDAGSKTQIVGNVTLSDAKTYIGLTTTTLGVGNTNIGLVTLLASSAYIGLVTSTQVGLVTTVNVGLQTLAPSPNYIGLVTLGGGPVNVIGNVTLSDPKGFIGLVTAVPSNTSRSIVGNVTLSDAKTFIGLVTVGGIGTVTLADPKGFIGLVTAVSRNAGTNKTLINLPIALSTSSIATIAVPTGGNALFYITQNLISSDATVRVSIKSGVTYLTGNASIGITLNPGGGWVENGGVDAPNYIGLASGAAIVVEKFDMTGTKANVGGKVMYFQE